MSRVVIQKNCEVLAVQQDSKEKDTYNVKVLFNNDMEEFAPEIPLKLKGSPKEISKILTFLGEEFTKNRTLEQTLDDLSIAPITFEVNGDKVIAKDTHGKELTNIEGSIDHNASIGKVKEFTENFFFPHKKTTRPTTPAPDLIREVGKVRSLWSEINSERTSTQKRIEMKTSLLQDFIRNLAREKGMPEEEIENGLEELKGAKSLNEFLNRAKLQYFPALSEELHELQSCDECKDHLRL
ncbi:MAG: hypothetical protein JSS60_04755 [Verrucomicrobia bacterium]|nr:hypothetical protein [Verrucomicrobiota bacterium]